VTAFKLDENLPIEAAAIFRGDVLAMLVAHLARTELDRRLWFVEETRIRMRE
jgi:hypothetical protein